MNQNLQIKVKTSVSAFGFTTIQDAIFLNLEKFHSKKVFHYSEDGIHFDEGLTYSELVSDALKAASFLTKHTHPGDRVLLLYNSGSEFLKLITACILTGVIAVPCPPPRNLKNLEKLLTLSKDCNPSFAIYGSSVAKFLEISNINLSEIPFKFFRDTFLLNSASLDPKKIYKATPESTVLLQYTSGSTGKPKGVIINHRNLISNVAMFHSSMNFTSDTIKVSWLPVYHDMGFVGCIISCILLAPTLYQSDPLSFASNPISWLNNLSRFRATLSGGPNFAFEQINKRLSKKTNINLDLSNLSLMYCGAEPIKVETLKKFAKNLETFGFSEKSFYPCYGMAESTLIISGADRSNPLKTSEVPTREIQDRNVRKVISVGNIFENESLLIIEPETKNVLGPNQVGEILISGPNVSQGYWRNSEETTKVFIQINHQVFLRTGDLGFISNDDLYVTGRHKDLIIINGRNIYPSDLEFALSDIHEIRPNGVVAVSYHDEKSEQTMLIVELTPEGMKQDLNLLYDKINKLIFEGFDISSKYVYLTKPGGVLRTTSGKVMRQATKKQLPSHTDLIVFESVPLKSLNL